MRLQDQYPSLLVGAAGSPSSDVGAFLPFSFELSVHLEHHDISAGFSKVATRIVESNLISQELRRVLLPILELTTPLDARLVDSPKKQERLRREFRGMGVDLAAVSPTSFLLDPLREELSTLYHGAYSVPPPKVAIDLLLPDAVVLGLGARRASSGLQLVAVAQNRGYAKDLSVRGMCGELWILGTHISDGSVVAKGTGVAIWIAGTILVPIAIAAFGKDVSDPAKEAVKRIQIQRKLDMLKGRCIVDGYVQLELEALSRSFEATVQSRGARAICIEQAALTIVGRNPGPIDGVDGPQTYAARQTFKTQWGVVDKVSISQEYVTALLSALKGSQPPSK